ncbi:MAG: hypothetical protein GX028_07135 [Clostridiaceae bacterium]|nr:hypothetical protein [Clostridiaceae bacterium]
MQKTAQQLQIPADEASLMPQTKLTDRNDKNGLLVIVFRQDQIGTGDQTVGRKLLIPYLEALLQLPLPPYSILFYNTGVRLLTEEGDTTGLLSKLETKGCELLACNLSLKQLGLSSQMKVGEISTLEIMLDRQLKADKILWP